MFISEVHANPNTQSNSPQPSPISGFIPILLIFFIFYFLVIRPQQKKIKAHNDMINAVGKGDTIITAGGVIGKIVDTKDNDLIHLEIADGVRIQLVRGSIASKSEKSFSTIASTNKAKKKK